MKKPIATKLSFGAIIVAAFCFDLVIADDLFAALDLEVPIEMGMIPCGSQMDGPHEFNRTKVRLNDADYDGDPRWYFEIIAKNADTEDKTITLRTNSGAKATLTVPAGTTSATRYRTAPFAPDSGWALYYLSLPATASDYQLVVWSRRIIIRQTNATKTRIQIPLFGRPANPHLYNWAIYHEGPPVWPRVTSNISSGVWEELGHTRRWKKEARKYGDLAPGSCWTFEAMMQVANEGPPANSCSLWNETTNQQVAASAVSNTRSTYTLHYADFPDDATGFIDGHEFGVRTKGHSSNPPRVAGAMLYVRLINLSRAQILYTVGYEDMVYGKAEGFNDYSRAFIDVSKYSSPTFYFESFGSNADSQDVLFLREDGTHDSGPVGTDVAGSGINFSSNQMVRMRTEAITLTGTRNYYVHVLSSPKVKHIRTSWLVIDVQGAAPSERAAR
jgi:hypothetical protein